MAVYRNLWVNWTTKSLQQSDRNGGEFVLPDFFKYESVPFRIVILADDANTVPEGYTRVSVAPITLTVSINDTLDDSTPLAQQQTWVADTTLNEFVGVLDLNTAAMTSYIGTSETKAAYFQIDAAQAGAQGVPIYQRVVTLRNSVTKPTTTSPDVLQTYYTAAQSDGMFMRPIGTAGQFVTVVSPSGNYARTFGVDDGGNAIDAILPYP